MVKKAYIIKMSIGVDIQIDEEELLAVLEAWETGGIKRLKQGFVRGDLIGCIVDDPERIENYDIGGGRRPINDIFKNVPGLPQPKTSKQLT